MDLIYADANGAAMMPPEAMAAWAAAANKGDPVHGARAVARDAAKRMARFTAFTETEAGMPAGMFRYIFATSGEEANALMLEMCVDAAWARAGGYGTKLAAKPHIVIGAGTQHATAAYLRRMRAQGRCSYNVAWPDPATGVIGAAGVARAVRPATCLIMVPATSPAGAITNLRALEPACFTPAPAARIPLHADVSVLHGCSVVAPDEWGVDAYTVAGRHVGGPPGIAYLAVRATLYANHRYEEAAPGRPVDVAALAAMHAGMRVKLADRAAKNAALEAQICGIVRVLEAAAPDVYWFPETAPPALGAMAARVRACGDGQAYKALATAAGDEAALRRARAPWVMIFSPRSPRRRMANTLLLALGNGQTAAKNKQALEERHAVVCADMASAGLELSGALIPEALRPYVLRISLPDGMTKNAAQALVLGVVAVLNGD